MPNYRYSTNVSRIETNRSRFKIPHNLKTTLNAGELIPVCLPIEVLPGDTWKDSISAVCRELTLLNPVMDNSYIQFDAFFVPMRIIWNHTKQFFGENDSSAWTETNDYIIPSECLNLEDMTNFIGYNSLGSYFGIGYSSLENQDLLKSKETFNYLPLRAYAEIWNYWYRDQNLQDPILYSKDDNITFNGALSFGYGSTPALVNRFGDLFTSALPQPQKGPSVNFLSPYLPVHTTTDERALEEIISTTDGTPLRWINKSGGSSVAVSGPIGLNSGSTSQGSSTFTASGSGIVPGNLVADTTLTELSTINALRNAIAVQHYYEKLALSGSFYEQYIYSMFGVNISSAVVQIPQYLGGYKHLLNVDQVLATAQGSEYTVGSTGAFSNTAIANKDLFTFSAVEHGYILILAHIRTDNTYGQGIPKVFSKKTKFDIYNPLFANIGNVAIKNKEIYYQNTDVDDEVFGYQEAWYEYRYMPNLNTSFMNKLFHDDGAFNTWSYQRLFNSLPVLNSEFITQSSIEVDDTIAVSHVNSAQFKLDVFHDFTRSAVMPVYSIPGLERI